MKKRLRKKLHKGEFKELGFTIKGTLCEDRTMDEIDKFFDDAIDFIVSQGTEMGGGTCGKRFEFFITLAKRGSVSEEQRETILKWFKSYHLVETVEAKKLVDAWYNDITAYPLE